MRRDYVANGGWETFLAYEDTEQDILVGLLRLRKCARTTFRPELRPELPANAVCVVPISEDVSREGEKEGDHNSEAGAIVDGIKNCSSSSSLDFCGCSIVRELHVYGSVVPVSARDPTKFQHQAS